MEITKDTIIGACIREHPEISKIFLDMGIFCVSCVAADFETIEQGLKSHGANNKEITEFVKKLNKEIGQ